ncbi:hypothetical protein DMUE_1612 [Dictyocoela muelleri]|nr:hypothetical protein DMUE_1612 [Dictyocoela muelleri]
MDSGSTFNYIGKEIVNKHNFKRRDCERSEALLVNGSKITSNSEVKISFYLENNRNSKYTADCKIIKAMGNFIILGMEFLVNNQVCIDLKENTIRINDTEYEIPGSEEGKDVEEHLDVKNAIMQVTSLEQPQKISKLLKENMNIQPIGLIPDEKHQIILSSTEIVRKTPYRLPLQFK